MSEKKLCIYDIEEKPPIWELLTYAFQHAIAVSAFVAVVGLLIARASNVPEEMFFRIIQVGFFASGITTIVVSYLGPPLGGKLPIIYITSTGFAPACIAIGERLGWGGVLGASFIGGIFMIFLVIIFDKIKRFFPPMVTGVIIMMIGLEMLPIGVRNMAGGTVGAPDFGAPENLIVGLLVSVVCVYSERIPQRRFVYRVDSFSRWWWGISPRCLPYRQLRALLFGSAGYRHDRPFLVGMDL
jgi:NCS2 family nucleobase:cation symporter-2